MWVWDPEPRATPMRGDTVILPWIQGSKLPQVNSPSWFGDRIHQNQNYTPETALVPHVALSPMMVPDH